MPQAIHDRRSIHVRSTVSHSPKSLPPGGRGTAQAVEGARESSQSNTSLCACSDIPHSPSVAYGASVSLRLGHARALMCHRHIIHSPRAASLPPGRSQGENAPWRNPHSEAKPRGLNDKYGTVRDIKCRAGPCAPPLFRIYLGHDRVKFDAFGGGAQGTRPTDCGTPVTII